MTTITNDEGRIVGTEDIQVELEAAMREDTHNRYMQRLTSAIERAQEVGTSHGQRMLTLHTDRYHEAVSEWIETAKTKRGRRHSALPFLEQIDSRTAAWMALREIINRIQQPQLRLTTLGVIIGRAILTEIEMRRLKKEDKALFTGILRVADKKSQQYRKETAARFLQEKQGMEVASASNKDCMLLGILMIEIAVEKLGIINLNMKGSVRNMGKKAVHKRAYIVEPTPELAKWIADGHQSWIDLSPVYEPMVVPPAPWANPLSGGYLTSQIKPLTLVKTRSKRYFRKLGECVMPDVYTAVNKIQGTPWRINHSILDVIQQLVSTGAELGGLPPAELLEIPPKPEDIATSEESRKAYRNAALKIHEENVRIIGRKAKVNAIVRTAEKFADFEAIYFPYQLDFRGRVYPVTALSPQGEDFVKALLEFANGEPLGTEQAADWLAVHIANLFGVDKVSFTDRILWTWQNKEMLLAIAEDPFSNRQWEEADKPFQALAAAFEWAGYMEHGLAHVSRLPVALDGSCSGLQHLGMALRCEVTGKAVNLLPAPKPSDIYQDVIDKVQEELLKLTGGKCGLTTPEARLLLGREAVRHLYVEDGSESFDGWLLRLTSKQYDEGGKVIKRDEEAKEVYGLYWGTISAAAWLAYGIDPETGKMSRKIAKRAVMTFPYGSKEYGFRDQLAEDIVRPDLMKHGDQSVFHEIDWQACGLMAKLLWRAVNEVVVKAAQAMEWLQQAASLVSKEGQKVSWVSPLGFLVEQGYVRSEDKLVETSFAGKERIRLTLPTDTIQPDSRKQAAGISPNFTHHLDSSHLMLTVARAPDVTNWALVHDSFGTLPSKTQSLFNYIRVAFLELYSQHDVLDQFRGQVLKQLDAGKLEELPPLPSKGSLDLHSVLQSQYCFA